MTLEITPVYAFLLTLLYLVLSFRVVAQRNVAKALFGDQGDNTLMLRIRAHGNFAEYAPFGVILLALAELGGAPGWGLHGAGAMLVVGRTLHALALSGVGSVAFRVAGMALTLTMLGLTALLAVL